MGKYRELVVWQSSIELALEIYRATSSFPVHERYGLRAQLRRAAVSIPSNIAEGKGRQSDREFRRFVRIAVGSLLELETQLVISEGLGYLDPSTSRRLGRSTSELGRMLNGLSSRLTADS